MYYEEKFYRGWVYWRDHPVGEWARGTEEQQQVALKKLQLKAAKWAAGEISWYIEKLADDMDTEERGGARRAMRAVDEFANELTLEGLPK